MADKKEKRYVSDNAELMAEWNWERNTDFAPTQLTLGSSKKVWWKCQHGHEWQAIIYDRNKRLGCPYCSNQKALKGFNDLQTLNPTLAKEWHYEKNNGLTPDDITPGSGKKVWWKCSKGHEWQATIASRNNGNKCPYCAGKKAIKGYNDLQTINPTLAEEWHYEKNNGLTPDEVTANSGKKVWWKCNKGHEWQVAVSGRNKGHGCPYCAGQKVLQGYNDLQTVNPTLANEWNYEKNGNLKPENVTANSGRKVWWKCNKGHEWEATIDCRNRGSGCPVCVSERHTSFPEYAIVYYLEKYGLEVIHSYKKLGYELDIYIPSKKTAIEYDGYHWHKSKTKQDLRKNYICAKDGIKLYRIREGLPLLKDSSIDYIVQRNQEDLSKILKLLLSEIIETVVDVDLKRDAIDIENLREYTEKENSLLFTNPEMAKDWNYQKNGNLKPEHFAANSHKKVWWKCQNGHEWQATIAHRNNGKGCPYCSSVKVLQGYNDLQTINPTLAREWNHIKNIRLEPTVVAPNSNKKVWWKCQNGHEWQATIAHRNNGKGCPYCTGKKVLKEYNDLQTTNPALAKEWNYEKNGDLKPENVTANSGRKVWWKCQHGHEWQVKIAERNKGHGCPYCSGRYTIKGEGDLQTVNPTLAKEWHYAKNNGLTPVDVAPNSNKKVWWKCQHGHEWQATIASRNCGRGCPYCSGRTIVKGETDLETVNPALAKEWHYTKNNGLTPVDVAPNSNKKVWWKCQHGHEWQARIADRSRGRGCPQCAKEKRKKSK